MDLVITFDEENVSFNVDCVVNDDEELEADDAIQIDELSDLYINNKRLRSSANTRKNF